MSDRAASPDESGMPDPAMPDPAMLEHLLHLMRLQPLPDEDTPLGRTTREFFANTYENARAGLLAKTQRLRVEPEPSPTPRVFRFEIDRPFKRKVAEDAPVELVAGPIRGTIIYRPDLFSADPEQPSLVVLIDPELHFFHPNYSREHAALCTGDIPRGPYDLELLLEHVYGILTYQNRTPTHPADVEAARYFAYDPQAMEGLETVEPLY